MSSLSGLRLALCAGIVVALTWLLYRLRPPADASAPPPSAALYRGAVAGAAILAALALISSPGWVGGLVAVTALTSAAIFAATK